MKQLDLPLNIPPHKRWTAKRKLEILLRISEEGLTPADIWAQYEITREEIEEWSRLFQAHGLKGLRSTRLLSYRSLNRDHYRNSHYSSGPPPGAPHNDGADHEDQNKD